VVKLLEELTADCGLLRPLVLAFAPNLRVPTNSSMCAVFTQEVFRQKWSMVSSGGIGAISCS